MSKSVFSVVKNNLSVTGYFLINEARSETGNRVLSLSRQINGEPVTIDLEFTKNGGVWINPAKYIFKSRISHFDYAESERRWTRRKNIMLDLVMKLQKADVWPFITNKKFFQVNENCSSFKKRKSLQNRVAEEMFSIMQPQKRDEKKAKIRELKKKADKLLK